MSRPPNMHAARMALNRDAELRQWAEQWLKGKERAVQSSMTDEEFEKHWLYVRPERMHEGSRYPRRKGRNSLLYRPERFNLHS